LQRNGLRNIRAGEIQALEQQRTSSPMTVLAIRDAARNAQTTCAAAARLVPVFRQRARTASKIATGDDMGEAAPARACSNNSASGSRVRIATIADASTNIRCRR
jgi:hypothetical protein